MDTNQLKAPVVRKSSAPRLSSAGNYSIIAHADQWVDSSSIRADNVVTGKRKRAVGVSYKT